MIPALKDAVKPKGVVFIVSSTDNVGDSSVLPVSHKQHIQKIVDFYQPFTSLETKVLASFEQARRRLTYYTPNPAISSRFMRRYYRRQTSSQLEEELNHIQWQ